MLKGKLLVDADHGRLGSARMLVANRHGLIGNGIISRGGASEEAHITVHGSGEGHIGRRVGA